MACVLTRRRTAQILIAATLLTTVATGGLADAGGGTPCSQAGRLVSEPHFLAVSLPDFPASDYPLDNVVTGHSHFVISADYGIGSRFRVAVANQSTVYLSSSGGCAWRRAYALPATVDSDGNSGALLANRDSILSVAVSKKPGTHDLYVEVEGPNLNTSDARVLVSHNDGKSFTTQVFPGLAAARPVTSPVDPRVVYVLGQPADGGENRLYRSNDAGASWEQLTMPAAVTWRRGPLSGLYVDPVVRKRLWSFVADDSGSVYRSDNAGRTWEAVGDTGRKIDFFGVWYDGRKPIIATAPTNGLATRPDSVTGQPHPMDYWDIDVSRDGGGHWSQLQAPLPTQGESSLGATLLALAQPTNDGDLVSAIVLTTSDQRNADIRTLTTRDGSEWSITADTRRPDLAAQPGASATVAPSSVGAWWLDQPGTTNFLLRYTREP